MLLAQNSGSINYHAGNIFISFVKEMYGIDLTPDEGWLVRFPTIGKPHDHAAY